MQFTTLPELTHNLVVLRPIAAVDLPTWFDYLSMPVVFTHTSWNLRSSADLSPYVWAPESSTPASLLRLAIALRSNDELIGTAGFHTVSPDNRSAELAYDLAPAHWGKGIATHVCQSLVRWAHSHVGLARIQATVLDSNTRSERVLQRCGFDREGLLKSYRMVRGRAGNFWMYAHVEPEAPEQHQPVARLDS